MPGKLDMDQQGAVGSLDLKKDRSHAQIGQAAPAVQSHGAQANGSSASSGQNGALSNGVSTHESGPATTNGEIQTLDTAMADSTSPPVLDGSWRESRQNVPLGKMLARAAQSCFAGLNETLTDMNAVQDGAQRPQINGALQKAQDTSEASLTKKRMLMEFAQNHRDRFIRALVLSDTSRREEEHGRMIDVRGWLEKQRNCYIWAMDDIGNAKIKMMEVKQTSPDIESAMEVLSTGKSTYMPDLGFIPPKKPTAKELLRTLRDMNVNIATRLSLHDELSPHMQDYTIGDGKVTFKVPGEFEVDLSNMDDDPGSQYFFIDLRLAFKPSTGVISSTLRDHLEARVNHYLRDDGLPGCYDFLHNFVLTHKINVLRSQVTELTQGKWFDCIRVENLRRSLTLQYWAGRPGPKSWIEVGISSGKVKGKHSRMPEIPCITVRWFRKALEIKDEPLNFDWSEISLERCLTMVIEKHTAWIVDDLQARLKSLAPAELDVESLHAGESSEQNMVVISLPTLNAPIHVRIEPVTGQYSLSPQSGPMVYAERRLNNDPTADSAQVIANALCGVAQDQINKTADLLHWAPVPGLVRQQDNLKKMFGDGVRANSTFIPRKAWGERWALAVTFTLAGQSWWAVSLEEKRDEQGNPTSKVISNARRLQHVPRNTSDAAQLRFTILEIERCAIAEVAFAALSKQLTDMNVQHRFQPPDRSPQQQPAGAEGKPHTPRALFFAIDTLLRHGKGALRQTWANNIGRLTHHGMVSSGPDGDGVRHDLRIAVSGDKMKQLQRLLSDFKDRNLVLSENGGLALRILAPFGKPFAEQIRSRLQSIERLEQYVKALKKHGLACTHVSLSRLSFSYRSDPELTATLLFPTEDGLLIRLKLQPSDINPHTRIRVLLENGLNEINASGVEAAAFILLLTLPMLQAVERIEARSKSEHSASLQAQTSTRYLLKYTAPLPVCTFEIRSRLRKEGKKRVVYWSVQPNRGLPDALAQALSRELWQTRDKEWRGVGNGLLATAMGIGDALDKLDSIVRRVDTSAPATVNGAAKQTAPAQDKQQQNAPQAQGNTQGQAQAKPNNAVKKEQPDVIMLDD